MNRYFQNLFYCLLVFAIPATCMAAPRAEDVLATIAQRCRETRSDSVLISHRGNLIFEYRASPHEKQLELGAITQPIAGLAIAFLIEEGKIESFDVPVSNYYPQWNQGEKKTITIRHLLTHTSGLSSFTGMEELNKTGDIIQYALAADVIARPGCSLYVNNKAVNLIGGIVQKASGKNIRDYLNEKLFCPLGIQEALWLCDSTGHEYCMAHLQLSASDLIKIGQMLGNGGIYNGKPILHPELIRALTRSGQLHDPCYGFLWDLDYHCLQCYRDEEPSIEFCGDGTCTDLAPTVSWGVGSLKSYSAEGDQGQQFIVWPHKQITAVRLVPVNCSKDATLDPFEDLRCLVEELSEHIGL